MQIKDINENIAMIEMLLFMQMSDSYGTKVKETPPITDINP